MAGTRKNYTNDELERAVQRVLAGESSRLVSEETGISYSTVRKWVVVASKGITRETKRRGPAPALPAEAERSLFEWVVGRQQVGYPVERREIIRKASSIAELLSGKPVGDGWYRRFLERNPGLAVRRSQSLAKVRNNVQFGDVMQIFYTLAKLAIERRLTRAQLFNIDETALETRAKSKQVVALSGSKNVWSTDVTASFHLTIVACGSAAGRVIPPVFVLPGKTVRMDVLKECGQDGAAVTTTESGFINAIIFERWLHFFAAAVPTSVPRPLVLLMDGCSSHYSAAILNTASSLNILMVCLPSNATHLFQPLDVAVFGAFKRQLRTAVNDFGNGGAWSVDKASAIKLASLAWDECNFPTNIVAGFQACGLFPLSLPKMRECLDNFKRNGVPREARIAEWFKIKEVVQDEVLVLPPPKKKSTRRRSTITVASRLLTQDLLRQVSDSKMTPRKKRYADNSQTVQFEAIV